MKKRRRNVERKSSKECNAKVEKESEEKKQNEKVERVERESKV